MSGQIKGTNKARYQCRDQVCQYTFFLKLPPQSFSSFACLGLVVLLIAIVAVCRNLGAIRRVEEKGGLGSWGRSVARVVDKETINQNSSSQSTDQTFYLTQSQYAHNGPTSPSSDPMAPCAWQGSYWSAIYSVIGMTRSCLLHLKSTHPASKAVLLFRRLHQLSTDQIRPRIKTERK